MKTAKPSTVAAYLSALPADQRAAITSLRALVRKHLPEGYEEAMNWGAITYQVPLKRCPDTYNGQPLCYVALAAQKRYCSLYLMAAYGDARKRAQLTAAFSNAGKKLDMGKACIRFRTLADLPLEGIADIIAGTPVDAYVAAYVKNRKGKG